MAKVVLTADEALMSPTGGGIFLGFAATLPATGSLLLRLFLEAVFRPVPSDKDGQAKLAPLGLRAIESVLKDAGFDVICTHPINLEKVLSKDTAVIGVGVMDPKGQGPASSTFSGPYGISHNDAFTHIKFRKLMKKIAKVKGKAKVILGGYGAWQITENDMEKYGIDYVVIGEGERIMPELVSQIIKGKAPETRIITAGANELPSPKEIPKVKGATCGGLVEISRGCGRSCRFCSPTMRRLRHRPIEDILNDVKVNLEAGQNSICLHAEDVLQYKGTPVKPNPDGVVELFERILSLPRIKYLGMSHASLTLMALMPKFVERLKNILGFTERKWLGFQTGIETGSPKLIESLMHMKPYPFSSSDWKKVVVDGMRIASENNFVPAATIIINLPGETEDDIFETTELILRLKPIKSLIVPLLFVPFDEQGKVMHFIEDANWYHFELYKVIWEHNMFWFKTLMDEYLQTINPLTKAGAIIFGNLVLRVLNSKILKFIEGRLKDEITHKFDFSSRDNH